MNTQRQKIKNMHENRIFRTESRTHFKFSILAALKKTKKPVSQTEKLVPAKSFQEVIMVGTTHLVTL